MVDVQPLNIARKYFENAYPTYSIVETRDIDLGSEQSRVTLLVEADEGSREEARIVVDSDPSGPADVVDIAVNSVSDDGTDRDGTPDHPVEAAREYVVQAFPNYSVLETDSVDLGFDHHHVTFLVETPTGETQLCAVSLTDDELEVIDITMDPSNESSDEEAEEGEGLGNLFG